MRAEAAQEQRTLDGVVPLVSAAVGRGSSRRLVVPVEEVSHWVDLDEETNAHLMKMAHRVAKAQMTVFSPERVGMIIAGFEVPHTHLHVVPIDSEGQLSFAHAAKTVDHEQLKKIAEELAKALS